MTNNWVDLDNSSMFYVQGANPAENHPASIAHLNTARFGPKNAQLVVVDPRLTRTARLVSPAKGDFYARIRPGTDIAFINGVLNLIFADMYAAKGGSTTATSYALSGDGTTRIYENFFNWHNGTNAAVHTSAARTFADDGGTTRTLTALELATATYDGAATSAFTGSRAWPKYTDSRAKVNGTTKNDYQRAKLTTASGWSFTNMPVFAENVDDVDTVFQKLRGHVAKYPAATVAAICGCSTTDIATVAKKFIQNSRFASSDCNVAAATPTVASYKATTIMYAMGITQHTCGSQNIRDYAIIQSLLGNMGRAGGGINALRGIHNVQGSTDMAVLYDGIPGYSGNPGVGQTYTAYTNSLFGNRVAGITTNSPYVAANLGLQQRGFYNMTREWFGSRAIGAAPVSTVIADEPITLTATDAIPLVGSPVVGGTVTVTDSTGVTTYVLGTDYTVNYADGKISRVATGAITPGQAVLVDYTYSRDAGFEKLWACWPKGNGYQHTEAFRLMIQGSIKAAVIWGQNPAVTEPNQSAVRDALANLDLMVVTELFGTETVQCHRKPTGVTYLLPTCAHVEEAGSVSSSGRWIQWRDRASLPKGNSKADVELLLRLAKALDGVDAFSHIKGQWVGTALEGAGAYDTLFAKYGWDGVVPFESAGGNDAEGVALTGSEWVAEQIFKEIASPLNATGSALGGTLWIYAGNGSASAYNPYTGDCDPAIYQPRNVVVTDGAGVVYAAANYTVDTNLGTLVRTASSTIPTGSTVLVDYEWGNSAAGWTAVVDESVTLTGTTVSVLGFKSLIPEWTKWAKANRAKSRKGAPDQAHISLQYPRYGWAWLLNRRVMYNNGELAGDVADVFVAPGVMARLFTINTNTFADWSLLYRAYNTLADRPDRNIGAGQVHEWAGRFPGHTEPYESPHDGLGAKTNLVSTYGYNTRNGARLLFETGDAVGNPNAYVGTPVGSSATYPFVLTTIRCVEHFQGGPITRNNPWNVECEPEPWIELNSVDALAKGIKDGDLVNITTARSNSTNNQNDRTISSGPLAAGAWNKGFRARVGVGTLANQRVAPGVVAIPWHWGDRGLSTGTRANDLCIDAYDANTMIPEYKACLCNIVKITS